jgi:hypothetical protein
MPVLSEAMKLIDEETFVNFRPCIVVTCEKSVAASLTRFPIRSSISAGFVGGNSTSTSRRRSGTANAVGEAA